MHRYSLQPYTTPQSRFHCPACNHRDKTFSRYIDTETGQHLGDTVGRCNREDNCGYHYTPRQWFTNHTEPGAPSPFMPAIKQPDKHPMLGPSVILGEIVLQSYGHYTQNNLVLWLRGLLGDSAAFDLVQRYCIGTSKHWPGASVFWQIDTDGRARTGKIMLYNPHTGKRVKEPFNHITWVHSVLYAGYQLRQCFFGEHLLTGAPLDTPVAITESEKTALLASVYLPRFTWLAAGSLNNINLDKCKALQGRKVLLVPDINAHDKWLQKAKQLAKQLPDTQFSVFDLLEQVGSKNEASKGLDLGDVLVRKGG